MQAWPSRVASWIQPEMANNRVARGIVLVPCLLLGGAFLATAVWGQGVAAENRPLATAPARRRVTSPPTGLLAWAAGHLLAGRPSPQLIPMEKIAFFCKPFPPPK